MDPASLVDKDKIVDLTKKLVSIPLYQEKNTSKN